MRAVKSFYEGSRACVRVGRGEFFFFFFLHGRKQLKGTKKEQQQKSPLLTAPIKEKKGVSKKRDQTHEERCPDTLLLKEFKS